VLRKSALVTGIACLASVVLGCPGPDAPAPALIRLWERADATLVAAARAPAAATAVLYDARAGAGAEGFQLSGDVANPLGEAGPELAWSATELDGVPAVRLAGPRGLATRVVLVQGEREYELSATVRSSAGSKVLAVELDRSGPPEELFVGEDGREHVVFVHELPRGEGRTHVTLRTTPATRALALMYLLQPVADGGQAFLEVAGAVLREAAPEAYWRELAREHARDSNAGAPPPTGWRTERFVRTPLCRDVRPSILLLPGESLSFELRVPDGRPIFRAGIGPWQTGVGDAVFVVDVDGRQAGSASVAADHAEWQELTVDLAAQAGKAVRLTLRVQGQGPGVFGAPMVVDRANVPAGKNVILVSIDTLRADHLGAYGYERNTSPHMDALAASSLFFADATAQAPYTLPSHVTMLSGQFPSVHGVQELGRVVTSERTTLLSETLAARGYRTMAFTGGGYVASPFGLDRGFDRFVTIDAFKPWDADTRCGDLSGPDAFIAWIQRTKGERFLLFLHTFVVHNYDPPPGYEGRFRSSDEDIDLRRWVRGRYARFNGIPDAALQRVVDTYDDAIAYADDVVGRMLATLEAEGLADDTIVVVTSDHGEELFDRGSIQHGDTLYEEITRVPLIVHVPGTAPGRIETPVMVADVTPTILGALGLPPDPRMQGVDLSKGRAPERSVWSEVTHKTHQYALRDPAGWKMIFAPREGRATPLFEKEEEWELFRLNADPRERRALDEERPDEAERMRAAIRALRRRLEAYGQSLGSIDLVPLGADDVRDLRKLGYM
jgi:hypothetical protein